MDRAVTRGEWPVIGHVPLTSDEREPPTFFKQDALSKQCSLYLPGGREVPTTPAECAHLERAAVWEPRHVVDRLNDHYAGRRNKWFESLRVRGA